MPITSSSGPEFIWQRPDWPTWRWSEPALQSQIDAVEQARLRLLDKLRGLDLAMMQTSPERLPQIDRVWAVSAVIDKRKQDYWAELEAAQRGDLDITSWLRFAMDCVARAYAEAGQCVDRVMQVAWFWVRHRGAALNGRQRKALSLALSGDALDDGWLTNRRYIKLTQCGSPVTASRDLAQLEQWGLIIKDPDAGGRSTRYAIALDGNNKGAAGS